MVSNTDLLVSIAFFVMGMLFGTVIAVGMNDEEDKDNEF